MRNSEIGDILVYRRTLEQELRKYCLQELIKYKNNSKLSDSFSHDITKILNSTIKKEKEFTIRLKTALDKLKTIYNTQIPKEDLINNCKFLDEIIRDKSIIFISFHTLFNTAFFMTKHVLNNFEQNKSNRNNIIPAISAWHIALESYISFISINLKLEYNQSDTLSSLFNKIYLHLNNYKKEKDEDYKSLNQHSNINNMLKSLSSYRNALFHGDMEYYDQNCNMNFSKDVAHANEIDLFKCIKIIMECVNFYRSIIVRVDLMPNINTGYINSGWIKLDDLYTDFLIPSFLKIISYRETTEDFNFELSKLLCNKKSNINIDFYITADNISSTKNNSIKIEKFVDINFNNYCKNKISVPEGHFRIPQYVCNKYK